MKLSKKVTLGVTLSALLVGGLAGCGNQASQSNHSQQKAQSARQAKPGKDYTRQNNEEMTESTDIHNAVPKKFYDQHMGNPLSNHLEETDGNPYILMIKNVSKSTDPGDAKYNMNIKQASALARKTWKQMYGKLSHDGKAEHDYPRHIMFAFGDNPSKGGNNVHMLYMAKANSSALTPKNGKWLVKNGKNMT